MRTSIESIDLTETFSFCILLLLFVEILVNALESNWAVLLEEIGLWIPSEITINEHDDIPEGEEESGNVSIFFQRSIFLSNHSF